MPPMDNFMGFGLIPTILQTAVAIAFIWLMLKLGRVLDAHSSKITAKS